MKLKKGDTVMVTTGKDKGKKGKIERVIPGKSAVVVAGVNIAKRHMKKRDEKRPGGIIDIIKPLPFGNVALVCPGCNKQTRVGFLVAKNLPRRQASEKVRICKKCGKKV